MYIGCRTFGLSNWVAVRISLFIAPGGEFAFVLLTPALKYEIISKDLRNIIILVATLSMMLTPLLDRLAKKFMPVEEEHDDVVEEEVS